MAARFPALGQRLKRSPALPFRRLEALLLPPSLRPSDRKVPARLLDQDHGQLDRCPRRHDAHDLVVKHRDHAGGMIGDAQEMLRTGSVACQDRVMAREWWWRSGLIDGHHQLRAALGDRGAVTLACCRRPAPFAMLPAWG